MRIFKNRIENKTYNTMNWKFENEFREAHPETIGETDKLYDYSNYVDWLESELVNKNDLLQRVSTRLLEMEGDAYHEALNYQATGETYREIASNGLAKGYADAIRLLNENGC